MKSPVLIVASLTACSGCQLTFLSAAEDVPEICSGFSFSFFPLAGKTELGPADAALVEGAVSTAEDLHLLMEIRRRCRLFIAYGTCAGWAGVAAMANGIRSRNEMVEQVYGPGCGLATFEPSPLKRFVQVDYFIPGCPPEKPELLQTLGALRRGALPDLTTFPVCMECRESENRCLLAEDGLPCLGPLTRAGCGARCPSVSVQCEGCRGPAAELNVASILETMRGKGIDEREILSRMRRFCPEWDHERRY